MANALPHLLEGQLGLARFRQLGDQKGLQGIVLEPGHEIRRREAGGQIAADRGERLQNHAIVEAFGRSEGLDIDEDPVDEPFRRHRRGAADMAGQVEGPPLLAELVAPVGSGANVVILQQSVGPFVEIGGEEGKFVGDVRSVRHDGFQLLEMPPIHVVEIGEAHARLPVETGAGESAEGRAGQALTEGDGEEKRRAQDRRARRTLVRARVVRGWVFEPEGDVDPCAAFVRLDRDIERVASGPVYGEQGGEVLRSPGFGQVVGLLGEGVLLGPVVLPFLPGRRRLEVEESLKIDAIGVEVSAFGP